MNDLDMKLAETLIEGLLPNWVAAPEKCPSCGGDKLERSVIAMGGPFSGSLRCPCGYTDTVCNHLVKTCFKVEPLPPSEEGSHG
jgi:hypothetical protein